MADRRGGIDSGKDYRVSDSIDDDGGVHVSTNDRDGYWRDSTFVTRPGLSGLYLMNLGMALCAVDSMSLGMDD